MLLDDITDVENNIKKVILMAGSQCRTQICQPCVVQRQRIYGSSPAKRNSKYLKNKETYFIFFHISKIMKPFPLKNRVI